ncbi:MULTISPECIES: DeoR/GlpR family DNA-binding transcription regulator [Allobranchiibius]|uniref:DeoR/GlpR family transcriptional regulator of sugar metabolism n=1 Tax=Allobranchiibius huperziae TaxID=1874116 RepID=A0A853DD52_9MICO|nr:DeoR/GlpR family DNA-binding transcription regulator [Allobranchiibius sp. GilTou73]NYJ74517.1 DeoR/GlpR family transcriptional regulator of sugar metabolism [Allobranchiibius huperziae]UIJ34102.1 DeoR/GlpR family DNA-binding transcription regulator [Allobranchiibius sp. GilTou73]
MLARERQERILSRVRADGSARVAQLTAQFGVSEMTIRRDLDQLDSEGLVDKVHGGATMPRQAVTDEPGFSRKSQLKMAEKKAIAREAAALIRPGWAVGFGGGTTAWQVAQELGAGAVTGLTIVTNSIQVATAIDPEGAGPNVILTGGLRTPSDALVGPVALNTMRSLHLDALVLGAHGFDPGRGLTTPNLMESEINRAMIDGANRLIVVADSSKWGVGGLATFARFDEIDILVTDTGLPRDARTALEGAIGAIHLVDVQGGTADEGH